ncbi:MAG: hypothetical protein HY675_07520 [Chloroflexi bacterium]|nr:hypothetical protein [Chloroflexota bacterium]
MEVVSVTKWSMEKTPHPAEGRKLTPDSYLQGGAGGGRQGRRMHVSRVRRAVRNTSSLSLLLVARANGKDDSTAGDTAA